MKISTFSAVLFIAYASVSLAANTQQGSKHPNRGEGQRQLLDDYDHAHMMRSNGQKKSLRGDSNSIPNIETQPMTKKTARYNDWQSKVFTNMDNEALWISKDLSNYNYLLTNKETGDATSVTVVEKNQATGSGDNINEAPTMDELFKRIHDALKVGGHVDVTYDAVYGFPALIQMVDTDNSLYFVEITDFSLQSGVNGGEAGNLQAPANHPVLIQPQDAVKKSVSVKSQKANQDAIISHSWQSMVYTNMDHEAFWVTKDVSDYSYLLTNIGSGDITSVMVHDKDSVTGTGDNVDDAQTIDDLFRHIQHALQGGVKLVDMAYDAEYGFPEYIHIIYNDNSVFQVAVSDFTAL